MLVNMVWLYDEVAPIYECLSVAELFCRQYMCGVFLISRVATSLAVESHMVRLWYLVRPANGSPMRQCRWRSTSFHRREEVPVVPKCI